MKRLSAALLAALLAAAPAGAVDGERLRAHVAYLAGDALAGRAPGSDGEEAALAYIEQALAQGGVEPAGEDGWRQPVALIERAPSGHEARFAVRRRALPVPEGTLMLVARDAESRVAAPLFFAGKGLGDDSRMRASVAGKVVLLLYAPGEEGSGHAARQRALAEAGAAAVIAVMAADATFAAQRDRLAAPQLVMAAGDLRAPIEGVMSEELAVALVTAAGRDWDKLRAAAAAPGYAGDALGLSAELVARATVRRFDSHNVVGRLPGRRPRSGAVLLMAHWDGFGICRPEGAPDRICNGAADNATGVAALIEAAHELQRRRHDRDIYFLATTGEEHGFTGATAFADRPPRPLGEFVAAFNLDMLGIVPASAPVAIVGRGSTRIEGAVERIVRAEGRGVAGGDGAGDFVRRQDGYVLLERGVPTLMVNTSFADRARLGAFLGSHYHGPGDELSAIPAWDAVEADTQLAVALVRAFADSRQRRRPPSSR